MGCRVILSPQAIDDLRRVVRHIAKEDPGAARRIGEALLERVMILENFPLLGSPYAKCEGVRKLVSRPYIIFYRFNAETNVVQILRYWHGAQQEPPVM